MNTLSRGWWLIPFLLIIGYAYLSYLSLMIRDKKDSDVIEYFGCLFGALVCGLGAVFSLSAIAYYSHII